MVFSIKAPREVVGIDSLPIDKTAHQLDSRVIHGFLQIVVGLK
jgi:hypothetical protein